MRKLAWLGALAAAACAQTPTAPRPVHQDVATATRGEPTSAKQLDAGIDPDACSRSDDQASAFLDLARRSSDRARALDAAERFVDRLDHVATGDRRFSCYVEMQRDVEAVMSARCAAKDPNDHDCVVLEQIDVDVERMLAEKDANAAEETNDADLRRRAADRFFAIARARCAGPHVVHRCDEIVFNAAILYLRADDRKDAEAAQTFLRDSRNQLADSPLVAKLACAFEPNDAATCR